MQLADLCASGTPKKVWGKILCLYWVLFYGLEYVISIRSAMAVFLMLKALCLHLERYYATDSRSG